MTAARTVLRPRHPHDRPDLEVRVMSTRGRQAVSTAGRPSGAGIAASV